MRKPLTFLLFCCSAPVFAQNIGIGTSFPAHKLDVNGSINSHIEYRLLGKPVLKIASPDGPAYLNLYIGDSAGHANTTGYYNTFAGSGAGTRNTTGYRNTFFGGLSGHANITGSDNTLIGLQAGAQTNSSSNTIVGSVAGAQNTTGYGNTFIGSAGGHWNVSGIQNTFLGYLAGFHNASGSDNIFIGIGAGEDNQTGSGNTIIGSFGDVGSGNLTNATAIGYLSYVTQSHSLVLGSINGVNGATNSTRVGIGTTSPLAPLDVKALTPLISRFNGGNGMYIALEENNTPRGYIGSYSGAGEDVDFGTGSSNTTGKVHITIQNNPKVTVDTDGDIDITRELNRTNKTGAANLLPVAYGNINGTSGAIHSGSGNFTCVRTFAGFYEITITDESYHFQLYTTVITPVGSTVPLIPTTGSGSGKLQVNIWNTGGVRTDGNFHFAVYKQ